MTITLALSKVKIPFRLIYSILTAVVMLYVAESLLRLINTRFIYDFCDIKQSK